MIYILKVELKADINCQSIQNLSFWIMLPHKIFKQIITFQLIDTDTK